MRQYGFGKVHGCNVVGRELQLQRIEVDALRLGEVQTSLDSGVEEDKVDVWVSCEHLVGEFGCLVDIVRSIRRFKSFTHGFQLVDVVNAKVCFALTGFPPSPLPIPCFSRMKPICRRKPLAWHRRPAQG